MDLNAILQTAPILVDLLTRGLLWEGERGEIEGKASDGAVVCVGSIHQIESTESYLKAHPAPDTW